MAIHATGYSRVGESDAEKIMKAVDEKAAGGMKPNKKDIDRINLIRAKQIDYRIRIQKASPNT